MSKQRLKALLSQEFSSLKYQLEHSIPEGYLLNISQEEQPPRIMILGAKAWEGPLSKMSEDFTVSIKMALLPEDVQIIQQWIDKILQRFPRLLKKSKLEDGILIYKVWIE